jgi:hypothetical protein
MYLSDFPQQRWSPLLLGRRRVLVRVVVGVEREIRLLQRIESLQAIITVEDYKLATSIILGGTAITHRAPTLLSAYFLLQFMLKLIIVTSGDGVCHCGLMGQV